MTRVALYARVSTKEQDDYGTSLDTQMAAMERYALEQRLTIVGRWREDYTGTKHDRPQINEIKKLATNREIDAILCYSRDRYARSRIAGLMLDMHFKEAEVERLYVMREKSQDTPQGIVRDGFDDLMHEYEIAILRERSMRGRHELAQRGVYLAFGHVIYGYERLPGKKEAVRIGINRQPKHAVPELASESAVVRFIFDAYVYQGVGVAAIVDKLNAYGIPSPGSQRQGHERLPDTTWRAWSVYRILSRREYTGVFTANKLKVLPNGKKVKTDRDEQIMIHMQDLALIEEQTFLLAQKQLRENQHSKKPLADYLMSKRVTDANGHNMICNTLQDRKKPKRSYYACRRPPKHTRKVCDIPMFRVDKVDPIVWKFIVELIQDPEAQLIGFKHSQERARAQNHDQQLTLASLEKLIKEQQQELNYLIEEARQFRNNPRVKEQYRAKITECSNRIELLEREQQEQIAQIDSAIISDEEIAERVEAIRLIRTQVDDLENLPFIHRRALVELLNIRIILGLEPDGRKYVDICWYGDCERKYIDDGLVLQPSLPGR